MLQLPEVTLIALTGINYKTAEHLAALDKSSKKIKFGKVKLIQTSEINNLDDYSAEMLFSLTNYVDTEFALTIQADGYVLRPEKWTDEFLDYDYIGAPWPPKMHYTDEGNEVRVGNGGFSLRSKKLLDVFNKLDLWLTDNGTGFYHEDGNICVYYRKELEAEGIKFAPVELAARFSTELRVPETTESFGGHKYL